MQMLEIIQVHRNNRNASPFFYRKIALVTPLLLTTRKIFINFCMELHFCNKTLGYFKDISYY